MSYQVGEALVEHYKMFLHVFNLFMNCTKSTGDRIDYGQRQVQHSMIAGKGGAERKASSLTTIAVHEAFVLRIVDAIVHGNV